MITNSEIKRFFRGCFTQGVLKPLMQLPKVALNTPSVQAHAGVLVPMCILGCLSGYTYHNWRKDEKSERAVDMLLNAQCGIATDHLEDGVAELGTNQMVFGDDEACAVVEPTARGVAILDKTKVEIKQHRRVKAGRNMRYMNCVIAECKAKFGVPVRDMSNLKAVNRYAVSLMQSHGLRPSHIRDHVGMIVNMVFVPTKSELEGLAMLNSSASNSKKIQYLLEMAAADVVRAN